MLVVENERALSELRDRLSTELHRERASVMEETRAAIDSLREEHTNRVTELRHDYRAEVYLGQFAPNLTAYIPGVPQGSREV
jgi:hypothetical protein